MSNRRVVTVGSCNMDLVARAPRLPERGETLTGSSFDTFLGGKGLNQTIAAQRMGASVAMVARVGDDVFGAAILDALAEDGVDTRFVQRDPDAPTGTATIVVEDGTGANTIVVVPGANGALSDADVDRAAALIRDADVLLLQLEVPIATTLRAAQIAHEAGATVLLIPAPAQPLPDELISLVDVLLPNEVELRQLAGGNVQTIDGARALIARGCGAVVVTQGERGALLVTADDEQRVAPFAVQAVDTVGAGDAFAGALGALLAEGTPLPDALRYGSAAGALATTQIGAVPSLPDRAAVDALVRS
jgi:ribokinase